MADTTITIAFNPGLTVTAKVYPVGATAVSETIVLTESSRPGLYTGTVTAALSGVFDVDILAGTTKVGGGQIQLADDAGPYHAGLVNVGSVAGASVDGVGDFQADVSGLSSFDPETNTVDIGKVAGTNVNGVDDFKADVSELATQESVIAVGASIAALNDISMVQVSEEFNAELTAYGVLKTGVEYVHTQNSADAAARTANVTISEA